MYTRRRKIRFFPFFCSMKKRVSKISWFLRANHHTQLSEKYLSLLRDFLNSHLYVKAMKQQEVEQITNILINWENTHKVIPYFSDLVQHPVYGAVFSSLSIDEKKEVENVIHDHILQKLDLITKTKGGQLFKRFEESQPELFWRFREMNDKDTTDPDFQSVGKQVEIEMFKLEGILTEKMLQQEKGLEKVVESFYNLVYLFFPRFNEIE